MYSKNKITSDIYFELMEVCGDKEILNMVLSCYSIQEINSVLLYAINCGNFYLVEKIKEIFNEIDTIWILKVIESMLVSSKNNESLNLSYVDVCLIEYLIENIFLEDDVKEKLALFIKTIKLSTYSEKTELAWEKTRGFYELLNSNKGEFSR